MVRVVVDHNLIAGPVPAGDDIVIVRGNVPVKVAKPEAFPVPSRKHEDMLRSEATGEAPVCKRLINVEMGIVRATTMSDPLVVFGVNVRNLGMTSLIDSNAVLRCSSGLLTARRGRIATRIRRPGRSGTASGNVSAADCRRVTAAWLFTISLSLNKGRRAHQNG